MKDAARQERGSMTREKSVHQARWKGSGALFLAVGALSKVVSSGATLIQQPTLFLAEWRLGSDEEQQERGQERREVMREERGNERGERSCSQQ